ncbi:MAG: ribosomal subunit interface protein [Acidimicrobiia bacterium]|nr:MAG: ribosomal subunit interface protein [Acidimicrobiia bacterium]
MILEEVLTLDIELHTRNTSVDDVFRETVVEKLSRAARFFPQLGSVDVEIIEEPNPRRSEDRFRVELTTSAAGRVIRVESAAPQPEAALDDAVDRFARTLRRWKEKLIDSHRQAPSEADSRRRPVPENPVVRTKQFVMKPLTVEEAAMQMDLLGHDFFFFLNAETDKHSVLYRRRDGRLGLIEPA